MARTRVLAFEAIDLDRKDYEVKKTNPAYWHLDGVRKNFHFIHAPSYPEIVKAYADEGIGQLETGEIKVESEPQPESSPETPETDTEEVSEEKPWRELSWPKMRSKAAEFTEEPIKNKDMAIEVLEKAEQEGKLLNK